MSARPPRHRHKGRGATLSPANRYAAYAGEEIDDGWDNLESPPDAPRTTLAADASRRVITYNDSPDVGFDRSINPYRGCEHGCVYCFARPTHAWLGLSPGLDFETRLFYKPEAAAQLRRELAARTYRCAPIALGINTDAYQPIERQRGLTREIVQILVDTRHPFSVVTKSALIERDIDLLAPAAARHQFEAAVSLTTLDPGLARRMEPRAASPARRLQTIRALSAAGIPVTVLVAPLIPVLTDSELETILAQARAAGARDAGYVLLRLPHELKDMFRDWLDKQAPLKAAHVMNRLRDCRGGRDYDARFGARMQGTGVFAQLIGKRFKLAYARLGFEPVPPLDCASFTPPDDGQLRLF
ncbi:MAG: PA0069 family radical SAM protein [Sulfuricaulis sp.]